MTTAPEVRETARAYLQHERATLEAVGKQIAETHRVWRGGGRPEVLFTGCGSPFFLTRSAAAMYQAVAGTPAQACPSSDLMLFPEFVLADDRPRLLVAVSRSGTTTGARCRRWSGTGGWWRRSSPTATSRR